MSEPTTAREAGERRPDWLGHPPGLGTLFFTEMWERFSYYGMRAILMFFMVAPAAEGGLGFGLRRAGAVYGTYTLCVYLLAIPGGFIGDNFFGARRAVLAAGILIALGHFTLALPLTASFPAGLGLVALGSGLLKPNMATLVGGLYRADDTRRDAGFSLFYLGVNLGAFSAPLATGYLAQSRHWKRCLSALGLDPLHCWHWGFAAAGVGMVLGLAVFFARRGSLAHVGPPPGGGRPRPWGRLALVLGMVGAFLCYVFKSDQPGWEWMRSGFVVAPVAAIVWFAARDGLESRRIAAVIVLVVAAMAFWTVFEQAGTTIALFSDRLTRPELFGWAFPTAWFQSLNSLFVIVLAPAFAWLWVRLGDRQPSSPAKFALGLAFLGLSFALLVPAARLTGSGRVSPLWLVGLFFLQTVGELCLSPVGVSAMTKLAPPRLAGLVMGIWFLADALGNKLAGVMAGQFPASDPMALGGFFLRQALVLAGFAAVLAILSPWVRRLMGGIR